MRALITGAAGFFGSRAASHLASWDVHGVDVATASRDRLEALAPRTTFHALDLQDSASVRALLRELRPEVVIHLAWYAVPGKYLEAAENLQHLEAAIDLVRVVTEAGCRRLLTAGTCFEYDTAAGYLRESTPTLPRSLYAASKLAMFEVLRAAAANRGVSYAHLRFFYQYGPWEAPLRLVPAVIAPLLRGEEANVTLGDQVRDFLHIDDVGRAIALVAETDVEGIVNIGSGVPVRVRDVVAAAARACGRPELVRYGALPARPGDPPFVCADVSRLRGLGFTPRYDLEEGLRDTVAWYRARGRG